MYPVLILGAGKIGRTICKFLSFTGEYDVCVGDVSEQRLESCKDNNHVKTLVLNAGDADALARAMKGRRAVISALPFTRNRPVAEAALAAGASYFDLTEDVATAHAVRDIAEGAVDGQIFMPQCGLAPGFISIAANHLVQQLEETDTVLMRVGALPMYPTNALKYNLTWSTDGLINEYCNPCEAISEGENVDFIPLEGLEHFAIDGVRYEAFNTSGGLGTLCDTLRHHARTLNYKTVRYPGHRDLAAFLIRELKLGEHRDTLKDILENAIPATFQDVVLAFCTATGQRNGRLTQVTDARKVYYGTIHGENWSAIQITTAGAVCAALDLHVGGKLPGRGFVRQEQIALDVFLENRFGQFYAIDNPTEVKVQPLNAVVEVD